MDELLSFQLLERITRGQFTDNDLQRLRQLIVYDSDRTTIQLGKYNVNIEQGQDIRIGDTIYQGSDAETIKELLRDVLQEYQLLPDQKQSPTQVWRYLHTFRGHVGAVNSLVIAPDQQTLISGGDDHSIRIWQLNTMQFLHELPKGQKPVSKLTLTP